MIQHIANIYTVDNLSVVQLPGSIRTPRVNKLIVSCNAKNDLTFERTISGVTITDSTGKVSARPLLTAAKEFAEALGCTTQVVPPPRKK